MEWDLSPQLSDAIRFGAQNALYISPEELAQRPLLTDVEHNLSIRSSIFVKSDMEKTFLK